MWRLKKCGISVAVDGSENNEIHIKDLDIESDDDDLRICFLRIRRWQ